MSVSDKPILLPGKYQDLHLVFEALLNDYLRLIEQESAADFTVNGSLYVSDRDNADSDKAGFGQLWVKSNTPDNLYFTDDTGRDYLISGITSTFKTSTTSRSSTSTLADDSDLAGMVLDDSSFYKIEAYIGVTSASNVPDFKWRFQFSSSPQSEDYRWNSVDSVGGSSGNSGGLTDTFNVALSAGDTFDLHFIGYIRTGATGGTLDFQWAQNTSDPTSTDLLLGSFLQLTKLGDA